MEEEPVYLLQVPDNYVSITSGLGESKPGYILIVPLKINSEVEGVMELASFRPYETSEIQFAATLATAQTNERTRQLLEQSQMQAEQMRAQEEEMQQNTEEMQATQEEFHRTEREYQQQNELLQRTIADLQARTKSDSGYHHTH